MGEMGEVDQGGGGTTWHWEHIVDSQTQIFEVFDIGIVEAYFGSPRDVVGVDIEGDEGRREEEHPSPLPT